MFKLDFKAKICTASKNSRNNYYMIGFADDKYDYKNYIIFQKPIKLGVDDDPEAELNGLYAECNGDVCYNCCKFAKLSNHLFYIEIKDSIITIDINDVKVNNRFVEYAKEIFGDLLIIDNI